MLEVLQGEVGAIFIFKNQVKGSSIGNDRWIIVLCEGQQVLMMPAKSCITPFTAIKLDAVVQEVHRHTKCL